MATILQHQPTVATHHDPTFAVRSEGAGLRPLFWVLAIGTAVRLVLWLWGAGQPIHIEDERDYHALAVNLVRHGEYGFAPGELTSLRPPLYPLFVAGIYALFGVENLAAVRFIQGMLSLLTVVVVYALGCSVSNRRVANWLAALCCFYPSLLIFNNFILSEVLFTCLLCTFCLLVVTAIKHTSLAALGVAGIALGLAALTRSVVWLFPPVLGLFLLWAWKEGLGRRPATVAVFVLAFALTIAPWAVRNSKLQDTFVAVDVMGGRNFMMGNYQHTPFYRSWDAIALTGDKAWSHEVITTYPPAQRVTQGQVDKLALRQGVKFVLANPFLTLERSVVKFFDFWGLEREIVAGATRGYFGTDSKAVILLLAAVVAGAYVGALFLAVFGVIASPLADRQLHWFLLVVVAFICGMHTLVFGHSRYHLPLMPIVLVFAALAIVNLRTIWQQRGSRRFALACGVCGVFAAGWIWLLLAVDLDLFMSAMSS